MDQTVIRVHPRSRREQKDSYEANKLVKRLRRLTGEAITDFGMIEDGADPAHHFRLRAHEPRREASPSVECSD